MDVKKLLSWSRFSRQSLALVIILFFWEMVAYGQESEQFSMKIGDADLYPSVTLEYSSFDNIYRDSSDHVKAERVNVEPEAIFVASRKGLHLTGGYRGSYSSFSEAAFNYNDHEVFGAVEAILTSRKRIEARAELSKGHEELGTGLTSGAASPDAEQIEIVNFLSSVQFIYGAQSARFNVSGGLLIDSTSYLNREDITDGRGYSAIIPFGQISYRLSNDTRALIELRLRNYSYDSSVNDRSETQLLTGLAFKGTAKTGGNLKLGVAKANYSDVSTSDESILTADIGLYFAPSSLSRFDLSYQREFNNEEVAASQAGQSQTINDFASIEWRKRWSGFIKSSVLVSYEGESRECPSVGTRELKAEADLILLPKRWLQLGVGAARTSSTADICAGIDSATIEYDLNEIFVFMTVTL